MKKKITRLSALLLILGASALSLRSADPQPRIYGSYAETLPFLAAMNGVEVIDDTATHEGPYYHAEVIVACVVNTARTSKVIGSLNGKTYAAGTRFRFQIDSLKLDSGEVHAWRLANSPPFIDAEQGGGIEAEQGGVLQGEN